MDTRQPLPIGAVLLDSLRVLGQGLPVFVSIAGLGAAGLTACGIAVAAIIWGGLGTRIDPRVLAVTMSPRDFAIIGVGIVVVAVMLAYCVAAAIHAAAALASGARIGLGESFRRVRAKGLQLFWLQWIVNILAVRFSLIAAPALWVLIAPAIPVAVLEDAGPAQAVDRMLTLVKGSRLRMLGLEFVLLLAVVLTPFGLGLATFQLGAIENSGVTPLTSLLIALPATVILLIPVLFMFVALTLAYSALVTPPALHARAPSGV